MTAEFAHREQTNSTLRHCDDDKTVFTKVIQTQSITETNGNFLIILIKDLSIKFVDAWVVMTSRTMMESFRLSCRW